MHMRPTNDSIVEIYVSGSGDESSLRDDMIVRAKKFDTLQVSDYVQSYLVY